MVSALSGGVQAAEDQKSCGTQLMPETLFLTTNLIDRFLELKPVTRKNLQLVRTALCCLHLGRLASLLW